MNEMVGNAISRVFFTFLVIAVIIAAINRNVKNKLLNHAKLPFKLSFYMPHRKARRKLPPKDYKNTIFRVISKDNIHTY